MNKNETQQTAAFTQGTYTFNENWALTLGVRWAEDEKSVFENRGGYLETDLIGGFRPFVDIPFLYTGGGPGYFEMSSLSNLALTNVLMGRANIQPGVFAPDAITPVCALEDPNCASPLLLQGVPLSWAGQAEADDDWSKVTWRANMDWTPNDTTLIYFGVTTGYRAGGYGLGAVDARITVGNVIEPLSYDEEEVLAVELGYKGQFFDDTLQINASIYRYDYEGYQDSLTIFDPSQNSFRDIPTNVGDAVNQGFEIEWVWLATDNLSINGNYSYTDTEYKDDTYFQETDDPRRPTAIFPILPTLTDPGIYNAKDESLKGIPEHKAVVWGTYQWNTDVGNIYLNGVVSYTGEYWPTAIQRDLDELDSRVQTDISLTWSSLDGKRRVRFFVDNIFDERMYRDFGTGGDGNNYKFTGSMLNPRMWGIDARWDFGDG